ncbi:MAG: PilZ domain-containing protein [Thermoanaerobaculia bacterium]
MDEGEQVFSQDQSAALVVLEFPSFRDFIDVYSPIISEQGIFIRDADVAQSNAFTVGDNIDFEVRLKDDFRLIQGSGVVVRLGFEQAAEGASGAAVRFREIDEPSQRLIARLVDNYVRDGGSLFEVGEPEVGGSAETTPELDDTPDEQPTGAGPLDDELTAETLQASEADALFATEGDSGLEPPVEFETVSPVEVDAELDELPEAPIEPAEFAGLEPLGLDPDEAVGLETMAIPSGLIASATGSEGEADSPGTIDPDSSSEADELQEIDEDELQELPPGADSVLSAAPENEDLFEPAPDLPESFVDEGSLEAAADSLDAELGARVGIPDEIAQVAEELSGVHRIEPPADERSGGYTGSASATSQANVGGRIAALVVVATLLGATAYYFGDTITGWLGLGGGDEATGMAEIAPGETMGGITPTPGSGESAESAAVAPDDGAADTSEATGPEVASAEEPRGESDPAAVSGGREPEATAPAELSARQPIAGAVEQEASPRPQPAAARVTPRRVENISWRAEGDTTVVMIRLDAEVARTGFEVVRVNGGTPREVLKIRGVDTPYAREVAIGGDHVVRLRTGLHQGDEGSALHVVADLVGTSVKVLSVEPQGRDLEITFSS